MKKNTDKTLKAITLFSGIGVDEFDLPQVGVNVKLACELSPKRVEIYKQLHSTPSVICGDLGDASIKSQIINYAKKEKINLLHFTSIEYKVCIGMAFKSRKLASRE